MGDLNSEGKKVRTLRTHHDDRDESSQEKDHEKRVDDSEPMNLVIVPVFECDLSDCN